MKKSILALLPLWILACGQTPELIRENAGGPEFIQHQIGVFLVSPLNTGVFEGPITFKLASAVKLSDGSQAEPESVLRGYYIAEGNSVSFAASQITPADHTKTMFISSMQTGRIALTPSSARYLKEAGKGAAVGAATGAIAGGLIGGLGYGWTGALVGLAAGAAGGAALGATSSASDVWLNGDHPVELPVGSGLIIHYGEVK